MLRSDPKGRVSKHMAKGSETLYRRAALAFVLAFPLAVAAVAPAPAQRGLQSFEKSPLGIRTADASHRFTVEVAGTARQYAQGLMYRRRLAADAGILFVYSRPQLVVMWMKNTVIPLDMLFIAADGRITRIVERTVPFSLENISSGGPVLAVLEINGGTASRLKIRTGDRVLHAAFATGGSGAR